MEQANVLRLLRIGVYLRKEYSVVVPCTVKILTVTSKTAQMHTLILLVPVVYRKKNVSLVNSPCVRQCGNKGRVYHVPALTVILLFLIHNAIENSTTLAHCK